jgi:hypothetical protein
MLLGRSPREGVCSRLCCLLSFPSCSLLLRERWAMDEWEEADISSNGRFPFHVLRDHPSHSNFHISGGLWGAAKGSVSNIRELLMRTSAGKSGYMHDMDFLNSEVWPLMREKGSLQHDAFSCQKDRGEFGGLGFPRPRAGAEHVGGVYDDMDIVRAGDVNLLPTANGGQDPSCSSPDPDPKTRYGLAVSEILKCSLSLHALLGETGEFGAAGPSKGTHEVLPPSSAAPAPQSVTWRDSAVSSAPTCDSKAVARLEDPTQLGLVIEGGTKWKRYDHGDMPRYRGLGVVGTVAAQTAGYSTLFHWKQAFVEHGWWAPESDSPSGCAGAVDSSSKVDSWSETLSSKSYFAGNHEALQAEENGSKSNKAIVPPSVFDYDRALLYSSYPIKCLPEEWLGAKGTEVETPRAGRTAGSSSSSTPTSKDVSSASSSSLALPSYAQVSQYHHRVERPHTHYTSLGPGGLRHSAHLLVSQALYTVDPHFIVSHALPYIWYFLHSGPVPYRQVLLPEGNAAVDDVMSALVGEGSNSDFRASEILRAPIPNANADAARSRGSYPKGAEDRNNVAPQGRSWKEQPWVSLQSGKGGPSLHYAHRAYVAALSGNLYAPQAAKLCSSVTALGETSSSLAEAISHSANAITAHATLLFADSHMSPRDRISKSAKCSAVVLTATSAGTLAGTAVAKPADFAAASAQSNLDGKGWKPDQVVAVDPCAGGAKEHFKAFGGASLAVIPPNTISPYLSYLRKGAKVLIARDMAGPYTPSTSNTEAVKSVDAAVDSLCEISGLECIRGETAKELIEKVVVEGC